MELHILARKPFDPATFIGNGWTIDERIGQRSGDTLDTGRIDCKVYLKPGESSIDGEECQRRIKASPNDPQLDEQDFLALYEEEGQLTLRWLYDTKGITWLSCWGVILRHPYGPRYVLYLDRHDDGSWAWGCYKVNNGVWADFFPAAVLTSQPAEA